jgi:hypothetical protein
MALLPVEVAVLVPRLRRSTKLSQLMCGLYVFYFQFIVFGFLGPTVVSYEQ